MGCDFLSLSGHKLGAPKGIGGLYIRKGVDLPPLIDGGGQENGMRSGTENVPYIIALGEACRLAAEGLQSGEEERVASLRNQIERRLLGLGGCVINGGSAPRVPGILNISFEDVSGEGVMFLCDLKGVCISTGSACSMGRGDDVSHVLRAMGVPDPFAKGSVRISIGGTTTREDAEIIASDVSDCVVRLRADRRQM
jgi:cysteine desulfurase